MYRIIIICLLCLFSGALFAQHTDPSAINPEKRNAWQLETSGILKAFRPDSTIISANLQTVAFDDYFRLKVRITAETWLKISKTQWIYFRSSSSHGNPETGDLTMAIDQSGKIYINHGHVCGGIINFETADIKNLKNSRQFFRYFSSDTDGERWRGFKSH